VKFLIGVTIRLCNLIGLSYYKAIGTEFDKLRENIYANINHIINHSEMKTATLEDIRKLIEEHKKYSDIESYALLPALLKKINARCEKNITNEPARFFRGRSVMANELYEILKKLTNPHDKRLLKETDGQLNKFIEKYQFQSSVQSVARPSF
jgi:hypothetical protein